MYVLYNQWFIGKKLPWQRKSSDHFEIGSTFLSLLPYVSCQFGYFMHRCRCCESKIISGRRKIKIVRLSKVLLGSLGVNACIFLCLCVRHMCFSRSVFCCDLAMDTLTPQNQDIGYLGDVAIFLNVWYWNMFYWLVSVVLSLDITLLYSNRNTYGITFVQSPLLQLRAVYPLMCSFSTQHRQQRQCRYLIPRHWSSHEYQNGLVV